MSSQKQSHKYFSSAVVAISLLFAIDACYSLAKSPSKADKFQIDQCDILNVVKSYEGETKTPDLALLGSSLMEVSSVQAAAIAANKPIDRLTHHRCDYLEKELVSHGGAKPAAVSLAVGGEMVSDAYLITKKLLGGARAPRAIVYGIGPRDFQDNLMPGVDSSDTFKLLSSIDDVPDVWQSEQLSPENKLACTIKNVSYIWDNRAELATETNRVYSQSVAPLFAHTFKPTPVAPPFPHDAGTAFAAPRSVQNIGTTPVAPASVQDAGTAIAATPTDRDAGSASAPSKPSKTNNVLKFIGGILKPGDAVWHPDDEYMLQNYLARYNPIAPSQIKTQLVYFERLLKLCKERQTPIMIVNMPLGETNQKVMAPGFYEKYLQDTRELCAKQGVPYVDLNVSPLNQKANFLDTVHLNPTASAQLFALMAKNLDPTIAIALRQETKTVATAPKVIY